MSNIIFYEDHARINITDKARRNAMAHALLASECFDEVVIGISELCIKFDPLQYSEDNIQKLIVKFGNDSPLRNTASQQHKLTADFSDALDIEYVVDLMNMDISQFRKWFLALNFQVDIMGFQPGFAYLSHDGGAPAIERLASPRSKISAGSIGFLGNSACIYAHDGPGGWPIIGKVTQNIFNVHKEPPNLFQSGDMINFI